MRRWLLLVFTFLCMAGTASARVKLQGYCSLQPIYQRSATCTVTIYITGTLTLATIFDDDIGTPKANPFTADANGLWFFYGDPCDRRDVRFSGGDPPISPAYTLSDFLLPCNSGGPGTVTNFSAGNLPPVFTTSVANPTTTPALTFILSNAPAHTVLGNATGAPAAPSYFSLSIGLAAPTGIIVSGSPVADIGTLTWAMPAGWTTGSLLVGNGVNSDATLLIGANTFVLTSNGTTALWAAPAAAGCSLAGVSNTQIVYDDAGACAGDAQLLWLNTSTKTLIVGDLQATFDAFLRDFFGATIRPKISIRNVVSTVLDSDAIEIQNQSTTSVTGHAINIATLAFGFQNAIEVTSFIRETTIANAVSNGILVTVESTRDSTNNIAQMAGYVCNDINHTGTGTVALNTCIEIEPNSKNGAGTITENDGIYIKSQFGVGTSNYGIHLLDQSGGQSVTQMIAGTNWALKINGGKVEFAGPTLVAGTTTVANLPAAAAGNKGFMLIISDSTAIAAEGQTCVGGSTNTALAFSNGVAWKCF